jgi:hypothetical protein
MERPETADRAFALPCMETQYAHWKDAIERFWSAATPDWRAAARLIAEIAGKSRDDRLRQAAAQALPVVRNASLIRSDRVTSDMAWRRLSIVRDMLHFLNAPRFGKRGIVKELTPDQHHRQMLGLPLGGRLAPAEIHQAFKQAAKTMHPDAGGNEQVFRELAAAREALMHPRKN